MTEVFTLTYDPRPSPRSDCVYAGNFASLAAARAAQAAAEADLGGFLAAHEGSAQDRDTTVFHILRRHLDFPVLEWWTIKDDIEALVAAPDPPPGPPRPAFTLFGAGSEYEGHDCHACLAVFSSRAAAEAFAARMLALDPNTPGHIRSHSIYESRLHGGLHVVKESLEDIDDARDRLAHDAVEKIKRKAIRDIRIAEVEAARARALARFALPAPPPSGEFPSSEAAAAFVHDRRAREAGEAAFLEAEASAARRALGRIESALRVAQHNERMANIEERTSAALGAPMRNPDGTPLSAENAAFVRQFIDGAVECAGVDSRDACDKTYCSKATERAAPLAHSVAARFLSPAELELFRDAYARCNVFLKR